GTYIITSTDARAENSRKLSQFSKPQKIFTVSAFFDPATVTLGDVIKLIHPRYGFDIGINCRIVGIKWTPTERLCVFDVVGEGVFCGTYAIAREGYSLDLGKAYCMNNVNTENIMSVIL
ncbi:hypothetical protein, partial [Candidatus Venteria ishoeyi]|uniref:hypothetical protein n=1 Tax=Candidatus Venteria ishoeyi TaxID=1899563 RepID=UPI0015ACB062